MVQKFEPLTREEELELAESWTKVQDPVAADRLVRAHLRFVVATAIKYRRYGIPIAELIAEGNVGLVHALKKFEPDRGYRFVTYAAYWIRAYILNHIIRSWSMVGGGSGALRSKTFFKLRRERVRISNLIGDRDEAEQKLADELAVSRPQLTQMLQQLESRDVSLDAPTREDGSSTMLDTLASPFESQELAIGGEETNELLERAVRTAVEGLDDRERYIVQSRIMADPEDELSLAEIGRQLGVSRERARQLEVRAKTKLRGRLEQLREMFDFDWSDSPGAMNPA
jgi:RNA polymerase sigma-32 factor